MPNDESEMNNVVTVKEQWTILEDKRALCVRYINGELVSREIVSFAPFVFIPDEEKVDD